MKKRILKYVPQLVKLRYCKYVFAMFVSVFYSAPNVILNGPTFRRRSSMSAMSAICLSLPSSHQHRVDILGENSWRVQRPRNIWKPLGHALKNVITLFKNDNKILICFPVSKQIRILVKKRNQHDQNCAPICRKIPRHPRKNEKRRGVTEIGSVESSLPYRYPLWYVG